MDMPGSMSDPASSKMTCVWKEGTRDTVPKCSFVKMCYEPVRKS